MDSFRRAVASMEIPPFDLQDRGLRSLAVGLQMNMAYPLMALTLGYWLMHRFSDLTPA